jgi:hypothetical protein
MIGDELLRAITNPSNYTVWNAPNIILTPASKSNSSKLVVFLSGTGASSDKYSRLLKSAQSAGNYVLGLSYLSQPFPVSHSNTWCTSRNVMKPDDCNEELHELMLFGDASPNLQGASRGVWKVRPEYSVQSILTKTLHSIDWGQNFLKRNNKTLSNDISWEKVVISGHSQGAGHAAYLSYKKEIPSVLFSGPQDCAECSQTWLRKMSSQNVTRRALFHLHEECGPDPLDSKSFCESNLMLDNLKVMGMNDTAFYWNTNSSIPDKLETVLSMSSPVCLNGRKYHNAVAIDKCATENIEDLWRALFSNF